MDVPVRRNGRRFPDFAYRSPMSPLHEINARPKQTFPSLAEGIAVGKPQLSATIRLPPFAAVSPLSEIVRIAAWRWL